MRKLNSIFQIITITIGVVMILIFLVPRIFGIVPFIVLSGSMEKEIKTGAIAYVDTKFKRDEIKVGDIIAFSIGDRQVTHRVIAINDDSTFTTKGDANNTADLNNVKPENYRGKTIGSIPYVGYILKSIQTKFGYAIIILLVIFNLAILIFSKDGEKVNKTKEKMEKEDNI